MILLIADILDIVIMTIVLTIGYIDIVNSLVN